MLEPVKKANNEEEARSSAGKRGRELLFVAEPTDVASWIDAIGRLQATGHRRFGARLFDAAATDIGAALADRYGSSFSIQEADKSVDGGKAMLKAEPQQPADAVLLIGGDAERISTALLDYIGGSDLTVVAPMTGRYWKKLPLYLISIPKAGTHLLFRLAEAMGYAAGGLQSQQPVGGHWYYLLNSNAHTTAMEFFRDELQKAPFGNRAHPFMRSPALFNYRNPLDILISEANYWHIDGNSPLSVLLSPLSFEERVARLIDNRWLLGTIRDRVGSFAAWLDCANVVPVSFEEMVGDSGGGSDDVLESLIWSLQLKLHVPGSPAEIRLAISDRSSATFREGKINGWHKQMPPASLDQFKALPQDFMNAYGYGVGDPPDQFKLPAHAMEYRRRPLRVMTSNHFNVPFLVETDYLGYNIVSYMDRYYAIEITTGEFDLAQLPREELAKLINAHNLPSLRGLIGVQYVDSNLKTTMKGWIRDAVKREVARLQRKEALLAAPALAAGAAVSEIEPGDERVGPIGPPTPFLGYNLFKRRDAIVALPKSAGAIDPRAYDVRWRPGVISSSSDAGARLKVFGMWLRWAYWDGAKL
jgi:hypothetical protein